MEFGLSHRFRTPEWMDQPGLDAPAHARALRGLARINSWSFSAATFWPGIVRVARENSGRPVRVLDIATGGGDVPIRLARRAHRAGLDVRIEGCDVSPVAVGLAARAANAAGVPVRFFPLDVLRSSLPQGYDVLTSSLFLHHLAEGDAVGLLERMAEATRSTILINDLLRSRIGYGIAWACCRLLSRSPVVHHDGPVSVRAAFTTAEARRLADRAGLHGARLERRWPWRFLLSWSRPNS
jgi:2-polyprenyl-3-methyl-5-hydroxy-6-metoxy-1,4-benzoquinol methylase